MQPYPIGSDALLGSHLQYVLSLSLSATALVSRHIPRNGIFSVKNRHIYSLRHRFYTYILLAYHKDITLSKEFSLYISFMQISNWDISTVYWIPHHNGIAEAVIQSVVYYSEYCLSPSVYFLP